MYSMCLASLVTFLIQLTVGWPNGNHCQIGIVLLDTDYTVSFLWQTTLAIDGKSIYTYNSRQARKKNLAA